jgi:hypothetical protein
MHLVRIELQVERESEALQQRETPAPGVVQDEVPSRIEPKDFVLMPVEDLPNSSDDRNLGVLFQDGIDVRIFEVGICNRDAGESGLVVKPLEPSAFLRWVTVPIRLEMNRSGEGLPGRISKEVFDEIIASNRADVTADQPRWRLDLKPVVPVVSEVPQMVVGVDKGNLFLHSPTSVLGTTIGQ